MAQCNLGVCHLNGLGCAKDLALALAWLSLSSQNGYPDGIKYFNRLKKEVTNTDLRLFPEQVKRLKQAYPALNGPQSRSDRQSIEIAPAPA